MTSKNKTQQESLVGTERHLQRFTGPSSGCGWYVHFAVENASSKIYLAYRERSSSSPVGYPGAVKYQTSDTIMVLGMRLMQQLLLQSDTPFAIAFVGQGNAAVTDPCLLRKNQNPCVYATHGTASPGLKCSACPCAHPVCTGTPKLHFARALLGSTGHPRQRLLSAIAQTHPDCCQLPALLRLVAGVDGLCFDGGPAAPVRLLLYSGLASLRARCCRPQIAPLGLTGARSAGRSPAAPPPGAARRCQTAATAAGCSQGLPHLPVGSQSSVG